MRRESPIIIVALLLISLLALSIDVQKVRAIETIYIRANGSIEPQTAPISTIDNVTYILNGNLINQTINVERSNITIDGNGYTLQGKGTGSGISASNLDISLRNVTIKNFHIDNYLYGILAFPEYGNFRSSIIFNNTFTNNEYGLALFFFSGGYITGNTFVNNSKGMYLTQSINNEILENHIVNNAGGVEIEYSSWNQVYNNFFHNNTIALTLILGAYQTIYHNNFVNNTIPVNSIQSTDFWNSSYPLGGNYWSKLNVTDIYSGPNQNESGSDGIGDLPFIVVDEINIDYYPLVNPYLSPADINDDLKIDIFDVVLCAVAYDSTPSDPNWNPDCDLAEPYGVIDILDIVVIASDYGLRYPYF